MFPWCSFPRSSTKGPGITWLASGECYLGRTAGGEDEDIEEAEIDREDSQEREEGEGEEEGEKEVVIDRTDVENLMKNYEMKEEEAVELLKKHKGDLMDVMNSL